MTHLSPTAILPATTTAHPTRRFFLLFASVLLLSFAIQFPIVYNFQFFAFYDPGTAFHALDLLAKHYRPTVDFGYTHGLLSLEFSRLWFALLGKSPLAFVAALLFLQMIIALGLARLAATFNLSRRATLLFCCLLPWAVIPDYLTLTHPLEAALLLHALADHAAGKRPRALAILTLTLFVKPSMAYVYGLVLLILIIRHNITRSKSSSPSSLETGHRTLDTPRRHWTLDTLFSLLPAALTAILSLSFVLFRYGTTPVKNTLFAVAGVSAYRETNFGLFLGDGRTFWLPSPSFADQYVFEKITHTHLGPLLSYPLYYLLSPAAIWILATLSLTLAGITFLPRLLHPSPSPTPSLSPSLSPSGNRTLDTGHSKELLLTLALLHTAFLLIFYGWRLSWTYYAYMPFFALPLLLSRFNLRRTLSISLLTITLLSHTAAALLAFACWFSPHPPEAAGLFAWNNLAQSYREVLAQSAGRKTLLFTNGYPTTLPPNVSIPDAWFPESGIATEIETARVRNQVLASDVIIVFRFYGNADLWQSPSFTDARAHFHRAKLTPAPAFPGNDEFQNSHFELWEKNSPY